MIFLKLKRTETFRFKNWIFYENIYNCCPHRHCPRVGHRVAEIFAQDLWRSLCLCSQTWPKVGVFIPPDSNATKEAAVMSPTIIVTIKYETDYMITN